MKANYLIIFLLFTLFFLTLPITMKGVFAVACKTERPAAPPILTSAVAHDKSVTLTWIEAQDPVTYYLLAYGMSKDNLEYGNPNIGGRGTTSFTVGSLKNGVKYYFRVQPGNGCKPGEFSNTLTAVPGLQPTISDLRIPNMSLLKGESYVLGTATSTAKVYTMKKNGYVDPVNNLAKANACAHNCKGTILLLAEVGLLTLLLFATKKGTYTSPVFSILIPVVLYVIYYLTSYACPSKTFICHFYLPLSIVIYIFFLVMQKRNFIHNYVKNGHD